MGAFDDRHGRTVSRSEPPRRYELRRPGQRRSITDVVVLGSPEEHLDPEDHFGADFPMEPLELTELEPPRTAVVFPDDPDLDPEEHFMVDGDVPGTTAEKPREQGD